MQHEAFDYADGSQIFKGELVYKKDPAGKHRPGIIVFHAFEGRNEFAIGYAEKLAEKGFVTLAADMYGDGKVATDIEGSLELISPFLKDRHLARKRAVLAFTHFQKHKLVDKSKIGAIGFCFGGMCVLELARSGEDLATAVTVHGVLAKSELPTAAIKSKLLILHGYQDPQAPPDSIQKFAQEMEQAGSPEWIFTFFGHAKHSFSDPHAGKIDPAREQKMGRAYDSFAAQHSFRYALDFFNEMAGGV
jgi:dienelactone hydrolase